MERIGYDLKHGYIWNRQSEKGDLVFAVGHPDLIAGGECVTNSFDCYPLGQVQQAGAVAALDDQAYIEQTGRTILQAAIGGGAVADAGP